MANGSGKGGGGGGGNKPPKHHHYKKFSVTVYVYAGGGYSDPANATPLPSFDADIKTEPAGYYKESDIDKVLTAIALTGYVYVDEQTGLRTMYPPNRISHIEAIPVDSNAY